MMYLRPAISLPRLAGPLALLMGGGLPAWAAAPAELPGGASEAFRPHMQAWSLPDQDAAAPVAPVAIVRGRATPPPRLSLPRLTSRFGYRTDPVRGGRRLHAGIDVPGAIGTPVRSSAGGMVRFAGRAGGYGEMVEIDHGGGLHTRYAHLSRIMVGPGATVAQGQVVGLMGSTGRSTGSHLHFEVRSGGGPVDPLAFVGGAVTKASVPIAPMPAPALHLSAFARRKAASEGGI